jgi:D-serine deaminase-like pyridoxal phosphate-dependent protein
MDPRSLLGREVDALTTPALMVEADTLEHNLKLMAEYFGQRACKLRPHYKSHKCNALAQRQLDAGGAVGITAAKLSEAEVLVAGGITDVLIANQVVGPDKARRVAELNRQGLVRVAVDSQHNVAELGNAAAAAGVDIGVLVEVDIGMNRCGVAAGEPTLELARQVHETEGLRLDGLQGFEGHLVLVADAADRSARTRESIELLVSQRGVLEDAGLPCPIVSGGGTGTYDVTGNIPGMDEMQAGTYALMDAHYHKVRPEFQCALSVLATVISARGRTIVADVGLKGVGSDFGFPEIAGQPDATVLYVAEEHLPIENVSASVGDRIRVVPTHGCTTCNLHRRMWIVRDNIIEDVWPINASGCLE